MTVCGPMMLFPFARMHGLNQFGFLPSSKSNTYTVCGLMMIPYARMRGLNQLGLSTQHADETSEPVFTEDHNCHYEENDDD